MTRICILYTELAGYYVSCLNRLCDEYDVEATLVAYPVNPEAPFEFEFSDRVRVIDRNSVDLNGLQSIVDEVQPQLIHCAGWIDKEYLQIVKQNPEITSAMGFDNQWLKTPKQYLATLYSRFKFKPIFDYAHVPGSPQKEFARRMGFSDNQIVTGIYACDLDRFNPLFEKRSAQSSAYQNKTLLYVGRYLDHKGIFDLFHAFIELVETKFPDWTLRCLGTGDAWDRRAIHPNIVHEGFVQPTDMEEFVLSSSAFVLPSHFEPWGVVVQEFAATGLPLVISDQVGARTEFLEEGVNGFEFKAQDKNSLQKTLLKIMTSDSDKLAKMGAESFRLAQRLSPDIWSKAMLSMIS